MQAAKRKSVLAVTVQLNSTLEGWRVEIRCRGALRCRHLMTRTAASRYGVAANSDTAGRIRLADAAGRTLGDWYGSRRGGEEEWEAMTFAPIPTCPRCSPVAKRKQGGGREWVEYVWPPKCKDCPRTRRLSGCSGRHVTPEQDAAVR